MFSKYLADLMSNAINPAFLVLILEEPLLADPCLPRRRRWGDALGFWLRSGTAIGAAVALAEAGKHTEIWPGHPNFPSGHTTFATAAAVCLIVRRGGRWAGLALPLVGVMAWSLIHGGWHTPDEVAAGLALGATVPWLLLRALPGRP